MVRRGLFGLLVLTLVGVVALGAGLWTALVTVAPESQPADLLAFVGSSSPPGSFGWKIERGKRITLLLMARGGAQSENPNVTDTMLLLAVGGPRPPVLLALPRWLAVKIPAPARGEISGQLYTAYELGADRHNPHLSSRWQTSTGGGDLAAATVSQVTGQPIDGWMVIDIAAFRTLVDALGGIRLTVPAPLDDPHYPIDDSGRTKHIRFNAGTQWMNGEQALEYARSRLSTSETDRARRQELVLTAILQRQAALPWGLGLIPLVNAVRGGVVTDLRLQDVRQLTRLFFHVRLRDTRRLTLDDSSLLYKLEFGPGRYVLLPRDGTFHALQAYLTTELAG